jgi:hypothetical protein
MPLPISGVAAVNGTHAGCTGFSTIPLEKPTNMPAGRPNGAAKRRSGGFSALILKPRDDSAAAIPDHQRV